MLENLKDQLWACSYLLKKDPVEFFFSVFCILAGGFLFYASVMSVYNSAIKF